MAASPSEVRASLTALTDATTSRIRDVVYAAGGAEAVVSDLLDAVPSIVDVYGSAAASMAADWYDEIRDEAGVAGRFAAEPVVVEPSSARLRAAIRWGVSPMFSAEPDRDAVVGRVGDRAGLWVVGSHRETITESVSVDRHAVGWQRHARAEACDFCRMLEGRGSVYRKETARFASHKRCHCTASVVFDDDGRGIEASVMQYRASARDMTDADRERVRDWIAANK